MKSPEGLLAAKKRGCLNRGESGGGGGAPRQ